MDANGIHSLQNQFVQQPISLRKICFLAWFGWLGIMGWGSLACKPSDPVERLILELRDNYSISREQAARKLGDMGVAASRAVPALRKVLLDRVTAVRRNAAEALGKIGPPAHGAIPDLVNRLWDKEEMVRSQSAWALGQIGEAALPELQKLLHSDYPHIRYYALKALVQIKHTGIAFLRAALRDPSTKVRRAALEALLQMGTTHLALLLPALQDPEEGIRSFVAWQLSQLAGKLAQASSAQAQRDVDALLKTLVSALQDASYQVRMYTAFTLGKFGTRAVVALDGLLQAIQDKEWFVRKHAIHALGTMGSLARRAIPTLAKGLLDETWDVKHEAALAVRKIDQEQAVRALIPMLAVKKWRTRQYIVQTLGWIGTTAAPAVPALCGLLRDDIREVRDAVAVALSSIGSASVKPLLKRIRSKDAQERKYVAIILGKLGKHAKVAIPALTSLLRDADWQVRRSAASALGQIQPLSEAQVTKIWTRWQHFSPAQRRIAAIQLASGGSSVLPFLPKIWALTKHPDPSQRETAWSALFSQMEHSQPSVVAESLQNLNQETSSSVWRLAALALALAPLPSSYDMTPYVRKIQTMRQQDVQESAVVWLEARPASPQHIAFLIELANSPFSGVQHRALQALYRTIPKVLARLSLPWTQRHLVEPLLTLASGASVALRVDIAKVLGQIGEKAVGGVSWLQKMLRDRNPKVRRAAASAIGWIGRLAHPAIPALTTLVQDRDAYVRRNAVFAISRMGKRAIKPLTSLLIPRQDPLVVMNVAYAFQRIWIPPQQERNIIESIKILLVDKSLSAQVRRMLERAIKRIESDDKPHVFWVDHPRSPTLEVYLPSMLFPHGT